MKPSNARARILVGIGATAIFITLALGALVYTQMRTIKATAVRVTDDTMPSIYLSGQLQSATLLRYILLTDYVNQSDERTRAELISEIESANARIDETMARYESLIDVPADARLFAKLKSTRKPYDECYLQVLHLSREGKRDDAMSLIETQLIPLRNAFLSAAEAEVVWNKADADDSANAITRAVNWVSTMFLLGLALVLGIAGIVLGLRRHINIERTLRESESRFHEVFEFAPVGICLAGPDDRLIRVNDALCRMLGYSQQELTAKTWKDLCPPEDLAAASERKQQLWSGKVAVAGGERRFIHRDGSLIWCQVKITLLRSADGKSLSSVVHVEDVTERKRAEEALRESEERFRSMADSIPSMMWVDNAQGETEFVNRAYREFTGITQEEAQTGKWQTRIHPDDAPAYLGAFEAAVRERKPFSAEGRVQRADGEWRMIGSRGEPRFSPGGEYLGHIGLRADITERRKAELEHQFQHSLIRTIHEVSLDGILVVNSAGRIVTFNKKFFDLWRIPLSQFLNAPFDIEKGVADHAVLSSAVNLVKDSDAFAKRVQELYADPDANDQCEVELIDGRTLERYTTSLRNDDGEYLARVWFFRDITERKRHEAELKSKTALLEAQANSTVDGMLVIDSNLRRILLNRCLVEMYGIPEALLADSDQIPLREHMISRYKDPKSAYALVEHLYSHPEETARGEFELIDGRILDVYSAPVKGSLGEYYGRVWTFRDITEQKRIEQTLKESEERFRVMADNCPVGIWVTNTQGETLFVNARYRSFCGVNAENLDPAAWLSTLYEDDAPEFIELFQRALRERTPFNSVYRARRADGALRWVETQGVPRFSPDGEFLGLVGTSQDIMERKQAEQELKRSEEKFRQLAENIREVFWMMNVEGTEILYVSPAYEPIWERSCESLYASAMDWLEAIHPDDRARAHETFMSQLKGERIDSEYRICTPNGEEKWIRDRAFPVRDQDGQLIRIAGTAEEITERKLAEQALRNSEETFRQLAENIREVFFVMTPSGNEVLYVSPAVEEVWGVSAESLYRSPMSWADAIHPDDQARALSLAGRQLQGELVDSEFRILTPDGKEKWIHSRTSPIRNQAGALIRVVGIAEEITKQKRYEQDLIRAREAAEAASRELAAQHATLDKERKILRAFIDNVPDLMYVKDVESRFVLANPKVAQWMGVEKPDDLLGKTDLDFYRRGFASSFYEDDRRVISTGEPIVDHEETSTSGPAEEVRYILTTKVPLFDSAGRITGIAGVGRDISARKKIENDLLDSNRQLREATDRANQSTLEAETANRAKSEFLANMSHEIRTPMNGVLGMLDLLLGSELETEQRHYAEVAEDSAKSLLTVINDILDFSKVEAGKLEIEQVDFNLHALMDDFAGAMAEHVSSKPVEFVCAVAPNLRAFLQGDPGRLRQVLINLAGNAMKFTHRGEVVLRADLISETENEVTVRFSVRDTGIGIPKNKQLILFTSFTQVDASTTRQYGGTGLGLAISKKLVELMGGEIGMESEEGKGSEFWFTLRFQKQLVPRHMDFPKAPIKGTRILVVDDNATNREVLTAQMQSWGAVVEAAENGSAALVRLRDAASAGSPFQLAVLDMMMPDMDGATLGSAILADDALKSTLLVMMTSLGQRADALRVKEIGFAAYLIKPVRQSDLFDCLQAVLHGETQAEKRGLITHRTLETARRSNARILLAEDNVTNQEVISGMLRRMGWHADVKANGKQAVEALEAGTYDLVLMDVQMPEMDGYEATRLIRDSRSRVLNHNIPVIATTAHAMAGDAEKCLAAGMSDYISKPIDPAALSKVVEKWLKRKVHAAAQQASAESATESSALPKKTPPASLVFNREAFLARMMDDKEFARDVATGFVQEFPALMTEMKQKVALGELESIWKHAHKMKGSAANVGAEALRDVAMEMERAGKAGDLAQVVQQLPELDLQAARLSEALEEWLR